MWTCTRRSTGSCQRPPGEARGQAWCVPIGPNPNRGASGAAVASGPSLGGQLWQHSHGTVTSLVEKPGRAVNGKMGWVLTRPAGRGQALYVIPAFFCMRVLMYLFCSPPGSPWDPLPTECSQWGLWAGRGVWEVPSCWHIAPDGQVLPQGAAECARRHPREWHGAPATGHGLGGGHTEEGPAKAGEAGHGPEEL